MSYKIWVTCGKFGKVKLPLTEQGIEVSLIPTEVDFGDPTCAKEYLEAGFVRQVPSIIPELSLEEGEELVQETVQEVRKRKNKKKKEFIEELTEDEPFEPSL